MSSPPTPAGSAFSSDPARSLSPAETEALRARWEAEAAERRARMSSPGVVPRATMATLSGAEFFTGLMNGTLPAASIGQLLGFVGIEFEPGRIVFQGTPGPEHYNPIGTVHGGYAATLLDSCVGCAIHTLLPKGKAYTTLELKVNYLRALTDKTGPVRAEGRVVHLGAQMGVAEGRLTDAGGRLYAIANTTCLVFSI